MMILPYLQKNGHIAGVRKLIQLEIDRHPEKVGPPIAVLRIDRNGPRWIERTPYCNPVRKFKP